MVSIRAALALGFAAVLSAHASLVPIFGPEMERYEQGFTAAQRKTHSFHATLKQTLVLQGLDQPIVSKGELFYLAPDKLLIRFSQPAGEWMLLRGKQLDLKKAGSPPVHRDLSQDGTSNAATLLDFFGSDSARWNRDFQVSMGQQAGDAGEVVVSLTPWRLPTSPRQGVDRIVTTLQLPGYEVTDIHVWMNQDNHIRFEFLDGQRNVPINPALFTTP